MAQSTNRANESAAKAGGTRVEGKNQGTIVVRPGNGTDSRRSR